MTEPPADRLIHIVDGDDIGRDSLRALLEAFGHGVCDFVSAEDYIAHAATSGRPACLIVNQSLPGMDAIDLLGELAARGSSIPAIVIADRTDRRSRLRSRKAAAVAVLEKPVDTDSLLAAIRSIG